LKALAALLPFLLVLIFARALPIGAQSVFPADGEQIPLLISDHHADHGPFMLRHFGGLESRVCMVVLDAHADTARNHSPPAGNHNWISPLYPVPLKRLFWINTITGAPGQVIAQFFYASVAAWGSGNPPLDARALSLDDISHAGLSAVDGQALFVSIDLDFFYTENNSPAEIPFVFDALLDFSSRWRGKVIWALALSRPWLPGDEYAWELLRQSLRWFRRIAGGKTRFAPPELTLFTTRLEDTSGMARSYRRKGLPVPSFFGRENEMPGDIKELLEKLKRPAPFPEPAATP
jgi:hypothetical protein